ncbi:MAG: hypothetical protein Q8L86_04880 [Vicinamibacterales bacterium]|nr:hypothetical protein [Vicinamibacterales bacterium]
MVRQLRSDATVSHAIFRLLTEFEETPGLRLTTWQASRLFRLDPAVCRSLLDALVEMKVLRIEPGGHYTGVKRAATPQRRSGQRSCA